jgi:Domain of unknown function (DUF4157)
VFAPKIAKPQLKTTESPTSRLALDQSTLAGYGYRRSPIEQALFLQRTIGNQATLRLLAQRDSRPDQEIGLENMAISRERRGLSWDFSKIPVFPPERASQVQPSLSSPTAGFTGVIQAKLQVGAVDDPLEHEADRVAEQVVHMTEPDAAVSTNAHRTDSPLAVSGGGLSPSQQNAAPESVHQVLNAPGHPLEPASRTYFETRFGHDFSNVRIHTDTLAADFARYMGARAFAVGQDIVMGRDQYLPHTAAGRRLLAHELTHTLQQRDGGGRAVIRCDPRHDKGHVGEQGMGFGYRQEDGWIFIEGPSGAGGHGITAHGFDGIAYHPQTGELHILDNKSLKAGTAYSATALTTNVLQNLDDAIARVAATPDLPGGSAILADLTSARTALSQGKALPANVKLVVTGEVGNVHDVSSRLKGLGVEFREPGTLDSTLPPRPPATSAPAASGTTPPSPSRDADVDPVTGQVVPGPNIDAARARRAERNAQPGGDGTSTSPASQNGPAPKSGAVGTILEVGTGAASLAAGLLGAYLKGKVDKQQTEKQVTALLQVANTEISKNPDEALKLMMLNPEGKLYAWVFLTSSVVTTILSVGGEPSIQDSSPILDLADIKYRFMQHDPSVQYPPSINTKAVGGYVITNTVIVDLPMVKPSLENLIARAKERGLPLDDLREYVSARANMASSDSLAAAARIRVLEEQQQNVDELARKDAKKKSSTKRNDEPKQGQQWNADTSRKVIESFEKYSESAKEWDDQQAKYWNHLLELIDPTPLRH